MNLLLGEIDLDTSFLAAQVPETFLSIAIGSKLIQKHFLNLEER